MIISVLITLLAIGNYLFFYDFHDEKEKMVLKRAIDGDTFESEDGRTFRMVNINTPEKKEFIYTEAKNFLSQFENVTLEIDIVGADAYGRVLARAYSPDYLNLKIIEVGLGHVLLVQDDETKMFHDAQERAFKSEIGIWKRSDFYGCVDVTIDKDAEYAVVNFLCEVNISGWTIKDESTRKYKFSENSYSIIKLSSVKGESHGDQLYWGRGKAWNDDRDSVFIRDKDGLLVYYDDYGY